MRPNRHTTLYVFCWGFALFGIVVWFLDKSHSVADNVLLPLFVGGCVWFPLFWHRHTRIVIDDTAVHSYDYVWGHRQMPRLGVVAVVAQRSGRHYSIEHASGERLLTRPVWTQQQLEELAELLNAPLRR